MTKKIILRVLLVFLGALIFGMIINSTVENIIIKNDITEFKNKGVLDTKKSTSTIKYYKVSRETWMSKKSSYIEINGDISYYGNSGDIVVGLESAIKGYPIITDAITFLFGGHASFVCYSDNINGVDNTFHIESTVNDGVSFCKGSFWNDITYRSEVIVLRLKLDDDIIKSVYDEMTKLIGKKYNNLYILNTKNRYYCTDFITRSFEKFGYSLNYDGFWASVEDIMVSKLTYISFYKCYNNGITSYYYIGD